MFVTFLGEVSRSRGSTRPATVFGEGVSLPDLGVVGLQPIRLRKSPSKNHRNIWVKFVHIPVTKVNTLFTPIDHCVGCA